MDGNPVRGINIPGVIRHPRQIPSSVVAEVILLARRSTKSASVLLRVQRVTYFGERCPRIRRYLEPPTHSVPLLFDRARKVNRLTLHLSRSGDWTEPTNFGSIDNDGRSFENAKASLGLVIVPHNAGKPSWGFGAKGAYPIVWRAHSLLVGSLDAIQVSRIWRSSLIDCTLIPKLAARGQNSSTANRCDTSGVAMNVTLLSRRPAQWVKTVP